MQINNHQIVDYDAVLDAKFGAEGTPRTCGSRRKKRMLSTPGKLSKTQGKRLKITQAGVSPAYRFRPFLYFKSGKWSDRT